MPYEITRPEGKKKKIGLVRVFGIDVWGFLIYDSMSLIYSNGLLNASSLVVFHIAAV
jgi:hypothetical protein